MTDAEIAELRRLTDAATPGPWTHRVNHKPFRVVVFGGRKAYQAGFTTSDIEAADAAFIAAARSAIPALLEEREALIAFVEDAARQWGYWSDSVGGVSTGGLSTLEDAFYILGWDDPHPLPDHCCDEPGCTREGTNGWPTAMGIKGGYRWTCFEHSQRPCDHRGIGQPGCPTCDPAVP